MRKPSLWTGVLGAAVALTMVARPASAVQETKIGVTSASNLTTTGFPPVSPEHLLKIGVEVVGDERVITTKDGRAQLLFLDHSALTIGPNSNLVLDKFVYDPDAGVGELAFSATKGLFRLVGGRISKKTPVTIRTSAGTIGIRGGVAIVSIQEGRPVEATFLFGKKMTVESEGQVVTATRPGSLVTFSRGNILPPVILTAERLGRIIQELERPPGKPTDSAVFVFQQEVKDAVLGALTEPAAGPGPAVPPSTQLIEILRNIEDSQDERDETTAVSTEEVQETAIEETIEETVAEPTAPLFSGRVKRAVSAFGFTGTDDDQPLSNIPFAGATADVPGGVFDATLSPTQQLTLNLQPGDFAATSTTTPFAGILTGDGFLTADGEFVAYELTDQGDGRDVLVWAGVPTPASAFPASGATFYELEPDFVLESNVPFINGSEPDISAGGLTISEPVEAIIDWDLGLFGGAAIVIDGAGTSQQSAASVFFGPLIDVGDPQNVDIAGRIRGGSFIHEGVSSNETSVIINSSSQFRLSRDGGGNGFFGSTNPNYFVLERDVFFEELIVQEGAFTDTRSYSPNVIALATPDVLAPRTDRTLNGFAAGLSRRFNVNGASIISTFMFDNTNADPSDLQIETDATTGTLTATFDVQEIDAVGNDNRLVASFGGPGNSAYFDDEDFGAFESTTLAQFTTPGPPSPAPGPNPVTATNLYMVTSEAFQSNNFPGAASECVCSFLEWGFWGGEISFADGRSERIYLANWVAGDNMPSSTDFTDLATAGATATYNGHLIGTVLNAGDVYQAMGDFGMNFDFAKPTTSTINVTNFDSTGYNATVSSLGVNGVYNAAGTDTSTLGRTINFTGAFFGGGGGGVPPPETGGQFNIGGASYTASGIFAGAR